MTKLSHEFDARLKKEGFVMGGPTTRVRYCFTCKKRLVQPRQVFKAETCFCRSCAIMQLVEDQEK